MTAYVVYVCRVFGGSGWCVGGMCLYKVKLCTMYVVCARGLCGVFCVCDVCCMCVILCDMLCIVYACGL